MEHHMQKHPMLSVKEAAEALKIDERSVRDRLTNGTLKGEKKMVGLREKWFVYSSAIQSALAKQDDFGGALSFNNPVVVQEMTGLNTVDATSVVVQERSDEARVQPQSAQPPVEAEDATYGTLDDITARPAPAGPIAGEWRAEGQSNMQSIVDAFMKPLVEKVAAQERALADQAALVAAQQKEIEEQKIQLRLLPDLERRAREEAEAAKAAELKLHEAAALQKQADLVADKTGKELAEKEAEMAILQDKVASVEEENKVLEVKANEAQQLSASLEVLSKKVEELQKPWWKKVFSNSTEG
jgi:DNA repair exonuclease SbcCD ATPase subunit